MRDTARALPEKRDAIYRLTPAGVLREPPSHLGRPWLKYLRRDAVNRGGTFVVDSSY